MKKFILSLIAAILVVNNACMAEESKSRVIAQELNQLLTQDPDIKMRMDLDDETIASFFDRVNISKLIAQQDSTLGRAFDHFFYNFFPGGIIQVMFKGLVHVSAEKVPQLHAIIQELCQKYQMPIPPIFIAGDKKLFNAFASSFSTNTAMVVLGMKMVNKLTDDELKAVLAHELSHIKNNHVPKMLALSGVLLTSLIAYTVYMTSYLPPTKERILDYDNTTLANNPSTKKIIATAAVFGFLILMTKIISEMSRMIEKEADMDALKVTENPEAFVASMERIKEHYEKELSKITQASESLNKKIEALAQISPWVAAYIKFQVDFYINAKITIYQDAINEENGTHPSMKARIAYGEEARSKQSALITQT